jgi:predicted Rossmann-fold nucleotide-binding protein
MTQNRNLSILADNVNSSGVLVATGGGTGIAGATFSAAMATWFATLPTTPPGGSPPQPWNNGGVLSFS